MWPWARHFPLFGPCSVLVVQMGCECRSPHSRSFALSTTPQKHYRHLALHQVTCPFPSTCSLLVPKVLLGIETFFQRPAIKVLPLNHNSPVFPSCRYFPLSLRLPWGYLMGRSLDNCKAILPRRGGQSGTALVKQVMPSHSCAQ